jgi:cyclic beta-1,2-glucan synthetase
MVHHQGMSLLSLAYVLLNKPMQQRFAAELRFQATLLLLQERVPRATTEYAHTTDPLEVQTAPVDIPVRRITTAATPIPEIQLLSNGRYHVMITNSGGGYSRWKDIAVTRWREDTTRDDRGIFCYIKDIGSGSFWSNTAQPALQPAKGYEVLFSQGHVEFRRQDFGIDTKTEIVISPEDDMEMRRVRITNRSHSVPRCWRSRAMPKWCWRARLRMKRIRPSATFLSRPRSCLSSGPFFVRADRDLPMKCRRGCST